MKKLIIIVVAILIATGSWFIWKHPHQSPSRPAPVKHCQNINNPCYKVVMFNQPDLMINSWNHYGQSDCIDFTSLPDGDFHGYCGDYKVIKLHN